MINTISVLVDDLSAGRCQRVILNRALVRWLGQGTVPRWLSSIALQVPRSWAVKPDVGRRLAAKLELLQSGQAGVRLYLSGNTILREPLRDLRTVVHGKYGLIGKRLADQGVLVCVGVIEKDDATAGTLLGLDYHQAADTILALEPLPDDCSPKRFHEEPSASIIDCEHMAQRPWHNVNAPASGIWLEQFFDAVRDGALSILDVEADIADGLVRPSLAYQLHHGIRNPAELPSTIVDLDAEAPFAAIRVPERQIRIIRTTKYSLPGKKGQPAPALTIETSGRSTEGARSLSGIMHSRQGRSLPQWLALVSVFAITHPRYTARRAGQIVMRRIARR